MKYMVANVLGAVVSAISFILQAAIWARLYVGREMPVEFFGIISLLVGAFFIAGYGVSYIISQRVRKPARSVDEHGAEFTSDLEDSYRFRRMYPNGKPTYPN